LDSLVIDTNVVSYILKNTRLGKRYGVRLHGHPLLISFMTLAELFHWADHAKWGQSRRQHLERELTRYVAVHSTPGLCELWARVRYERRRQPISAEDAWIAATALEHDCLLVTHNPRDFRGISNLVVITEATST
jgi:tRNA(fMet)-specific endonuclease VapC